MATVKPVNPTQLFHFHIPVLLIIDVFAILLISLAAFMLFINVLNKKTAEAVLRGPGLWGVTGRMGRGKSYLMTLCAWWAIRTKRRSCADCRSTFVNGHRALWANYPVGVDHHEYDNWGELINAPHGSMILLDEAQLWWGSADHAAPIHVKKWVTQIRKRHITCIWAAQDFEMVARWFRILSSGIWEAERWKGGHKYTLVDPAYAGKARKVQKTMALLKIRRKRKIMALYDTLGFVKDSREWGATMEEPVTTTTAEKGERLLTVEEYNALSSP